MAKYSSSTQNTEAERVRIPAREEIAEFIEGEGLPSNLLEPLQQAITHIATTISIHAKEADFSPEARKARLKHIGRGREALADLAEMLVKDPDSAILNRLLASELGFSLSTAAFEASGQSVVDAVSIHVRHSREASERAGAYPALEAAAMERRVSLAGRAGAKVFAKSLAKLTQRLDAYLDLERQNRGGRPAQVYRQYVIRSLAELFPKLFGSAPTARSTGPFVQLCDFVADTLGLATDGLEDAIRRELKKPAKRRTA